MEARAPLVELMAHRILLLAQFLQMLPRKTDWLRPRKVISGALKKTSDLFAQRLEVWPFRPNTGRVDTLDPTRHAE